MSALERTAYEEWERSSAQQAPVSDELGQIQKLTITARHLSEVMSKPSQVRWLGGNKKRLERGVIAVMAGKRGSYKSFLAFHWAMEAAAIGEIVLMITAEGSGADRRAAAWMKVHGKGREIEEFPVYLIERRVDFNSTEGVAALLEEIERLKLKPVLIIIDTLSKNSGGLDEDKNTEVKQFIGRLDTSIRAPLDCTVLLVAHTGHGDQSRPRGASAIEADTDAAYIVTKAGDNTVTVSRERFKDAPEMEPLGYRVEVVDLGYFDEYGDPVTSCVLVPTDFAPERQRPTGKCQRQLLAELEKRVAGGDLGIWTEGELREMARNLGMHKNSARDAVHGLRELGYFKGMMGGSSLSFVPESGPKDRNRTENEISSRCVGTEKTERPLGLGLSSRTSVPTSFGRDGDANA